MCWVVRYLNLHDNPKKNHSSGKLSFIDEAIVYFSIHIVFHISMLTKIILLQDFQKHCHS